MQPITERIKDIIDKEYLSLEGTKLKAEYDRKMQLANLHKNEVLKQLEKLRARFVVVLERYKNPLAIKLIIAATKTQTHSNVNNIYKL